MTESEPRITGVTAAEPQHYDEDVVYNRALRDWERAAHLESRRNRQIIEFASGPVAFAFTGDQHLGDGGTDIGRAFAEAELIRDTPGMYSFLVGDLLNQFVIGKLRQVRDKARMSISDEWILVRRLLKIHVPKLIGSVSGNHEGWAEMLIGVDYFREVLAQIKPGCLYDVHDLRAIVKVAGVSWPMRVRHKWRGSSIYNPTHGIERAFKWDQDFRLGVGAHFHIGAVAREFNAAGEQGLALMVGSYKRIDGFARRGGFAKHGPTMAAAVIFEPELGTMTGFGNVYQAAAVLTAIRCRKSDARSELEDIKC